MVLNFIPSGARRLAGWLSLGTVAYYLYRWYTVRLFFRRLKAAGLPLMPHSWLLGHIGLIASLPPSDFPMDAYGNYMQTRFQKNWKKIFPERETCPHVLYVDMWPFFQPVVIVTDPEVATQYMSHPSTPKHPIARRFLYPLTQNLDLVTSEGQLWKTWRARLNPGFSARNLLGLLPEILEEVDTFVEILRSKTGNQNEGEGWGDLFEMEGCTTNMTFDVIGRAGLGIKLGSQRQNADSTGFREVLAETVDLLVLEENTKTLRKRLSPWRRYKIWANQRYMDRILMPQIERELHRSKDEENTGATAQKTVLELSVKTTKEEMGPGADISELDPMFVKTLLAQLKIFLFAGHDTTATSLCWIWHELGRNPDALETMRKEHDEIFGKDVGKAREMLEREPALVNRCPYTNGVVKEGLRLHPNIASARLGSKSINLRNVPGFPNTSFPTEGLMIWDGVQAMHARDDIWVDAQSFRPERWMVTDENDPMHPPKNAWRPFSIGPRNCIGQELAMLEMKLTMIMTARELDVVEDWDEWDRQNPGKSKDTYNGERMYQIKGSTPHAKEGMPTRVRLARR
ncbi:hypothetical protein MKZ38_002574 [Zalerion maritima]|uniref:Cytochrome P450 n=1 Tax=Zalerion maritima TaxID=339359 RepID=A0AAD5RPR7_9PEZI|nr:hypothetical protein MKZ38_002574 [Zalerion maritima]